MHKAIEDSDEENDIEIKTPPSSVTYRIKTENGSGQKKLGDVISEEQKKGGQLWKNLLNNRQLHEKAKRRMSELMRTTEVKEKIDQLEENKLKEDKYLKLGHDIYSMAVYGFYIQNDEQKIFFHYQKHRQE